MQRRVGTVLASGTLAAALVVSAQVLAGGSTQGLAPTTASAADAGSEAPGAGDRADDVAGATLRLADGTELGQVRMVARGGNTRVTLSASAPAGLTASGGSFHGFHVHANDDLANGSGCLADPAAPPSTWFTAVDGHYAVPGAVHGDHLGDMPAVYLQQDGQARSTFVTDRFTPSDVVGRAVIVHLDPDNHGNVPTGDEPDDYTPNSPAATSLTDRTGNAGDRAACGILSR